MQAIRSLTVPIAAAFLAMPNTALALAIARTPTISGNGWVALGILGFFIGTIYMLIMGALHVERRDAALHRSDGHGGFFGILQNDEEDPGHPHHSG